MDLSELLQLEHVPALIIRDLQLDSRRCVPGTLFLAIPGHVVDGRRFIGAALETGASAALEHTDNAAEHGQWRELSDKPVIAYYQLREQLGTLAARFYQQPSQQLPMIGITGTNGKTTTSQICAALLHELGQPCGVLGTLGNGLYGQLTESRNTTPDAVTLQRTLRELVDAGAQTCAMEVSSHAMVQQRTSGCEFDVAVFTNLSRDHLDYHGDMQSYAEAKRLLMLQQSLQACVINADDPVGQQWLQDPEIGARKVAFSIGSHDSSQDLSHLQGRGYDAVTVSEIAYHANGCHARLHTFAGDALLSSPLLGAFNLENLLAALAALLVLGHPLDKLVAACNKLQPAPGRMEPVRTPGQPLVVVDYAHTPDALEQALKALRRHCTGKLWCVFGCGGDRDSGKRPLMGQAAQQWADKVIVTSDNPRSEQPEEIIEQILAGCTAPEAVITDREQAIHYAIGRAAADDVVLLAGKGHELYQEISGQRRPYSELAVAESALSKQS